MMICEAHHEILDNIFSEQFINLISNQLKVYIFIWIQNDPETEKEKNKTLFVAILSVSLF